MSVPCDMMKFSILSHRGVILLSSAAQQVTTGSHTPLGIGKQAWRERLGAGEGSVG